MDEELNYNRYEGSTMTLYREDIETILSLFHEHCKEVIISDRDRVYESLQELEKIKGKSPKVLYIMGKNPFAQFSIDPANLSIVCLDVRKKGGGEDLYFKIEKILNSRQHLIGKIYTPFSTLVLSFALAISIYILGSNDAIKILGIISILVLAVIAFIIANYIQQGGFSRIAWQQKYESNVHRHRAKIS